MSFKNVLERLKDAAQACPANERQRGLRDVRLVQWRDLAELVRHFERLDAEARMGYPPYIKELADAAEKAIPLLVKGEVKSHLEYALHLVRPDRSKL